MLRNKMLRSNEKHNQFFQTRCLNIPNMSLFSDPILKIYIKNIKLCKLKKAIFGHINISLGSRNTVEQLSLGVLNSWQNLKKILFGVSKMLSLGCTLSRTK